MDGVVTCKEEFLSCCFDEDDPCCLNTSGDYFTCNPETEPVRCNGDKVEACKGYDPAPPECNGGADWVVDQACAAGETCVLDPVTGDASCQGDTQPQPPILAPGHTGWREPKCLDCHTPDGHNGGLGPYQCAECHGNNGAPHGHGGGGNCACHGDKHGADGFPRPSSCLVCHP